MSINPSTLLKSLIANLEQEEIENEGTFCSDNNNLIIIYFQEGISAQIQNNSHIQFIKKQSGVIYSITINPDQDIESFSNCFVSIAQMFV